MAHIEFDWVAKKPFRAEHPLGSGAVVEYAPGDRVPANDWGQAAHHLEANDKIVQIAINVGDPGDSVAVSEPPAFSPGLSDPTRQFLAYEGREPLALEGEPSLEEPDEGAGEGAAEVEVAVATVQDAYPQHLGGGVYELSDGSHVRGKRRAESAQASLDEE
jgi:hypothetical protein